MPAIGRNPPYLATFAIFVILLVPTALLDNMAGLVVLRFLAGFFGSPCLATGGASLQDMFSLIKLPYVLSLWALAATCGPALGPIISGFSVTAENWRWSLWEMLWLAGPTWLVMFLFLPETSPSNILLRRARRLRNLTGDHRLKSQSEIDQAKISAKDLAVESLWRPMQMMVLDPAIAFTAVYTALIYGIFYSFFEVFPLVYIAMYGFNLGEQGLAFLSITVGVIIAIAAYWAYVYWIVELSIRTHGLGAPERRLIPALIVAFFCPIGLFIFGKSYPPVTQSLQLRCTLANALHSMDRQPQHPLDRSHYRHPHLHDRHIPYHPVHIPLSATHIPAIRRKLVRRQRLHARNARRGRNSLLTPAVQQPGRCEGSESARGVNLRAYCGGVRAVL